jgi:hypothetical protein
VRVYDCLHLGMDEAILRRIKSAPACRASCRKQSMSNIFMRVSQLQRLPGGIAFQGNMLS